MIYDGPLEEDGADPRLHMEFGVSYEWPTPGACTACGVVGPRTITKHPHSGPGNEAGWMFSRCPDHQAKYESRR